MMLFQDCRQVSYILFSVLVAGLSIHTVEGQPKGLACTKCLLDFDGTPLNRSLRVMCVSITSLFLTMQGLTCKSSYCRFMDQPFTTSNPAARKAAAKKGIEYSCDDPSLAVPEW